MCIIYNLASNSVSVSHNLCLLHPICCVILSDGVIHSVSRKIVPSYHPSHSLSSSCVTPMDCTRQKASTSVTSKHTGLCCRLRAPVFLLGGVCIHTKVLGACYQYLVPSGNFNDHKDLRLRDDCLYFDGNPTPSIALCVDSAWAGADCTFPTILTGGPALCTQSAAC